MAAQKSAELKKKRMSTSVFVGSILAAGLIIIGGSVFIGKSDSGTIDVTAAIQNSNQANTDGGDSSNNIATVPEAFRNVPNGGLVPAENQNVPPPQPEATTETASTTDAATSTPETDASSDASESQTPPDSAESATEGGAGETL